jgi:hypothetical protein
MPLAANLFSLARGEVFHRAAAGRLPPSNWSKYLKWMSIGDSAESGLRQLAAALGRCHESG